MKITHAFSGFSTDDLGKTKAFYADTLGLNVEEEKEMDMLRIKLVGGGEVMIYPKDNHQPATYTVLNLMVDNIEQTVDELVGKGVKFEVYEGFGQDEKAISHGQGPNVAWFKDPAGNILAVIEDKA